jgi:enoyl-CoA hydratase/carnithine racemase
MTEHGVDPSARWIIDRDDHVTVLRYDGGQRRTMGIEQARQLAELIDERAQAEQPPVLVLVLDILHAELGEVRQMSQGRPIADWAPWVAAIAGIENYPSASIATVPHQASCGGLELALAADLRVATSTARLGVLETRMGILPGAGGTQRLPELVGMGNAALLVLTGETVSGAEAHRMGLVQLLTDDAVSAAVSLAERLAAIGSTVLATAKGALAAGRVRSADGFRQEGRAFLSLVGTDFGKARIDHWLDRQMAGGNPALDPSPLP